MDNFRPYGQKLSVIGGGKSSEIIHLLSGASFFSTLTFMTPLCNKLLYQ